MTTGITRDETLAQEIINILFCKILDERDTDPGETVTFRAGIGEASDVIQARIWDLLRKLKTKFRMYLVRKETIKLDSRFS